MKGFRQVFPRLFSRLPQSLSRFSTCIFLGDVSESIIPPADSVYRRSMTTKLNILEKRLNDPTRFQHIGEREERSVFNADAVQCIINGKFLSFYRGIDMLKGPEDLSILYQMLWHVRPRTIIELGAFTGASALWMADSLKGANIECDIFSVDIDLSLLHPQIKSLQPHNLSFIEGDCNEIESIFPSEFLNSQPHPMIIIDDAHVDLLKTMNHFHRHLLPGDYIVCEDTNSGRPAVPLTPNDCDAVGLGKLQVWKQFLTKYGDMYAVDSFFSDYYGYNSSSNWNGYVRRMK